MTEYMNQCKSRTSRIVRSRLPTFLGIGAAKCGTTTLSSMLNEHPEISFPSRKELHFFDEEKVNDTGLCQYLSLFKTNRAFGEFTPSYMFDKRCRDLIYDVFGDSIKFIVILRNPVDRAYSHYCHAVKNWGHEKYRKLGYPIENLDFKEAVNQEEARLKEWKFHPRHFCYFSKGLYVSQLEYYFQRFKRDKFFICLFEELVNNPGLLLRNIYRFLGVNDRVKPQNTDLKLNSQSYGVMDTVFKKELIQRYSADIVKLSMILDKDLSNWYEI